MTMTDNKQKAIEEKNKGNEAYKKKNFAEAHSHFDKAIQLDPTNIVFYTNKSAVYFEEGKFDDCIKTCEKAVEVGRENRAKYATVARAYSRIGNAYKKQEKLEEALQFYDKSISEFRDPKVVEEKNKIEKILKDRERLAYIDPELANKAREDGNECFKKGDYPSAVKNYTEAIKRNPDDARIFSNRAACYQKLMEFPLAVADCDSAIKVDPNFIKAYIRKGHALQAMQESTRAKQAFERALDIDPNNAEAQQGYRSMMVGMGQEEKAQAAMSDPEVQRIMADPAMRLILEQMQNDPNALREHLQNPEIAGKISKLIEAGIIGIARK